MEELNYEKFLIYLRQFQNKMQKEFNDDLKHYQISSTHIGILLTLQSRKEGYSMSELSRLIKVDNALMTRNIKELEKIEYIYRNRENELQRKYHICLTEKGNQVAEELCKIMRKKQEEFINCFTEEERNMIENAIKIIIQKFMKTIEKEENNVTIKKY